MVFVSDINNGSNDWQSSLIYTCETATTAEQIQTEQECSSYLNLIDANNANNDDGPPSAVVSSKGRTVKNDQHINYFIEKGLITVKNKERLRVDDPKSNNDTSDIVQSPGQEHYAVGLLREAHSQYLFTIFRDQQKLRPSFTSLDSSHTWMIYWCLHGIDLLGKWQPRDTDQNSLTQRIISTVQSCWTTCNVSLSHEMVELDPVLSFYSKSSNGHHGVSAIASDDEVTFVNVGGFGGGPQQMPHAATTYAAIMSLCIIASSTAKPHNQEENVALEYLRSIRVSIYIWFCCLYNPINGSFRMHMDGEMDVRATYCVLAVVHVLQMIPSTTDTSTSSSSFFTQPRIAEYVSSCQSVWEGGYGGEPGAEAHGGYTYCAVAALQLLNAPSSASSVEICSAWLARRQMCYEGGFSGRMNKLVDGCYSFWQGAAAIIIREQLQQIYNPSGYKVSNAATDPWLTTVPINNDSSLSPHKSSCDDCPFDTSMLERYVLLCTQDENGGLRDKPSKGRDFYHSCYCLSGLSIVQHYGHCDRTTDSYNQNDVFYNEDTAVHRTHPCFNVGVEHVAFCQSYFRNIVLTGTDTI